MNPFLLAIISIFLILEIRRQVLISKAVKEILENSHQELRKKIPQLEAKRTLVTAIFFLIKKMGLGKKSGLSFVNSREIADLGSHWLKNHLGRMMSWYEMANPLLLNSFLPPLKAAVRYNIRNKKIFLGASIGCGLAKFEEKIINYCNKNKLPAVIFAFDNNKELILKAKKRMEKKKIMTEIENHRQKIDIGRLIAKAQQTKQSLICFIPASFAKFPDFFSSGRKTDLVWFLHSREHTIEGNPAMFEKIKKCTRDWMILETFRSWGVVFFANIINWWLSPVLATETEISIRRNYTPEEWAKKNVGAVIKRFPYFGWIFSAGVYKNLKESISLGKKDKIIFP